MDAGGTKTEYVLANDSAVLARTKGGTVKRMRASAEEAAANLCAALDSLEQQSGLSLREVSSTCVGAAGYTVPLVTNFLQTELRKRVGGSLLLLGDIEIALDAAFPGETGLLVLAGTGSNAAARTRNGRVTTAGGYGPVLSDQGSGHRIGAQALRAVFLAQDERRPNRLMDAILRFWNLQGPADLVEFANACPSTEISRLARIVLSCADTGDSVAAEVLQQEGEELAHLAVLLHRRVLEEDGLAWWPRMAFAGSILQHVQPVREALLAKVRREVPDMIEVPGVVDAVMGALWRARRCGSEPFVG